jgi:hypothetical protein
MAEQLDIPDGASRLDAQRIRQVNRNLQIRAAYEQLRDEHGRDRAFDMLAERHGCSRALIREVVYERR